MEVERWLRLRTLATLEKDWGLILSALVQLVTVSSSSVREPSASLGSQTLLTYGTHAKCRQNTHPHRIKGT